MADANSIRIIYIFEACARLKCGSEIAALACHVYHRFFRIKPDMSQFELYTFASACILLAHDFYEGDLKAEELAMIAVSILHGPDYHLSSEMRSKIARSITETSLVIAVNTNFEISFKDERFMTPGDFLKSLRPQTQEVVTLDDSMSVDSESADDDDDVAEYLLSRNSKYLISSHRYLTHYLYSIKLLVNPSATSLFNRLCNIAWIFLNDFYWSPTVMCHLPDHVACACLMMSIEVFTRDTTDKSGGPEREEFTNFIRKKWNLIFCDDLTVEKLNRTIHTIMRNYGEYEMIFRKEFTKDVIDP